MSRPHRHILTTLAADEAVSLLREVCRGEAVPALVVTRDLSSPLPRPVYDVAAQTRRLTPRSVCIDFELGPVLAWNPDLAALALAADLARDSVLLVVGLSDDGDDLTWWCAAAGGSDHTGVRIQPPHGAWDVIAQVRSWAALGSAGDWGGETWAELRPCLSSVRDSWDLTPTETAHVALACGVPWRAARRLAELVARPADPVRPSTHIPVQRLQGA